MSIYTTKFNPFSKSLQWVLKGTLITFKEAVDTYNNLPLTENTQNDARITTDTGNLYVWSKEENAGLLTDWVDQGDVIDLEWDAIEGGPSSTPTEIDDTVTKKHTQDTDTKLDNGGLNQVSAVEILQNVYNNVLLFFYRAVDNTLAYFSLVGGVIDAYQDETGVDTVTSVNLTYDSVRKCYRPSTEDGGLDNVSIHYKLNDNSANTTIVDSSDNGFDGVTQRNTTLLTATGKINEAIDFDPTVPDYITPDANFVLDEDNPWTITCWFFLDSFPSFYPAICALKTNGSEPMQIWVSEDDGGGGYRPLAFGSSNTVQRKISEAGTYDNAWVHVALVFLGGDNTNTSNYKVYINNVEKTHVANGGMGAANNVSRIGDISHAQTWFRFDGRLDDFRVYDVALNEASINSIWNGGAGTEDSDVAGAAENMTMISESFSASNQPETTKVVIFEEDLESLILNTDLLVYVSRDDGSTWTLGTLIEVAPYETGKRILKIDADLSSVPAGTSIKYKIVSANNKKFRIYGSSLLWQ